MNARMLLLALGAAASIAVDGLLFTIAVQQPFPHASSVLLAGLLLGQFGGLAVVLGSWRFPFRASIFDRAIWLAVAGTSASLLLAQITRPTWWQWGTFLLGQASLIAVALAVVQSWRKYATRFVSSCSMSAFFCGIVGRLRQHGPSKTAWQKLLRCVRRDAAKDRRSSRAWINSPSPAPQIKRVASWKRFIRTQLLLWSGVASLLWVAQHGLPVPQISFPAIVLPEFVSNLSATSLPTAEPVWLCLTISAVVLMMSYRPSRWRNTIAVAQLFGGWLIGLMAGISQTDSRGIAPLLLAHGIAASYLFAARQLIELASEQTTEVVDLKSAISDLT